MSDRELLELAARAAGYEYECTSHTGRPENDQHQIRNEAGAMVDWNPLADDGDALRLRNRLSAMIIDEGNCVFVAIYRSDAPSVEIREMYIGDLEGGYSSAASVNEATRRAVTRAAAEVGKNLK